MELSRMAVSDRSHRKPVCRVVDCKAEKARTWQCGRGWARPGHVDVVVVGVVVKGVACSLQLVVHALAVGSLLPENSTHHCRARLLSRPFPTATTVLLLVACWELQNERNVWLFGIHHQSSTEMFVVEKDQGGRSSSVHSGC